jgi:hypothetical protein
MRHSAASAGARGDGIAARRDDNAPRGFSKTLLTGGSIAKCGSRNSIVAEKRAKARTHLRSGVRRGERTPINSVLFRVALLIPAISLAVVAGAGGAG